ncbi:MAG: alanine racemase [Christensenellaceae bacterium]
MYRKTYAKINLCNLMQNIKNVQNNLSKNSGVVAVVKADAYGHGAVQCSKAAICAGACALAVALAEEALELRRQGIVDTPIIIIGRSNPEQLKLAVQLKLEPCVFTVQDIVLLEEFAQKQNVIVNVHLKIDTGMGRIGIRDFVELEQVLETIKKCRCVLLKGVFTHFANSDAQDKTDALAQNEKFMRFVARINQAGLKPLVHVDNSAGAIDLPQFSYDMVRFGISMYGYYPSPYVNQKSVPLLPVMQVVAEVSNVKEIEIGAGVGYGSTFIAQRKSRIATVQIGYGDGYNRLLSNRGKMIVHTKNGAQYANIVGRVCMDQTMIDITDIAGEVSVGDMVTVLGTVDDKSISADDLAQLCGTISYEVLLDFSKRVPRVYEAEEFYE